MQRLVLDALILKSIIAYLSFFQSPRGVKHDGLLTMRVISTNIEMLF